ncbi:hypothetical protein [Virgibacillus sediminis]|uniref:DUF4352 domain-containing protein n=1 Tax=Virgibacillus sediminis TaxID=202260 RepID=A0ABV7A8F9_9BACI
MRGVGPEWHGVAPELQGARPECEVVAPELRGVGPEWHGMAPVVENTPNGNIDTAGGVEYAYEIQNNSEIPVKDISFDVLMEFENGIKQVDSISEYETLMNGDIVGNSNATVYPEPAAKIKSYKIIGYQITDKDNIYYDVDT